MSFRIKITEIALKQYRKIDNPDHKRIKRKIDDLAQSGLDMSHIKALTGEFKGLYRLRVGNYRVIFDIEKEEITILSILHRKNAYR